MSDRDDYPSDSDESDEDFCPENLRESDVSEEEEDDDDDADDSNEQDDESNDDTESNQLNKKKKINKKPQRRKGKRKTKKRIGPSPVNISEDKSNIILPDAKKKNFVSEEDEKQKTDSLWANFLSDVNDGGGSSGGVGIKQSSSSSKSNTNINNAKGVSVTTSTVVESSLSSSSSLLATAEESRNSNNSTSKESRLSSSNKSLEQQREQQQQQLKSLPKDEKVKITQVFEFAGEEIKVEKEVSADEARKLSSSKLLRSSTITTATATTTTGVTPNSTTIRNFSLKRPASSGGGLSSILGQFGKKNKISVLEKSKLDWTNFKSKEGLTEEIQTFNKGKEGYLEKQDFLQRTDLKQFEIESSLRKSSRSSKR